MNPPNQIKQDFIVITPDQKALIERADNALFERLDQNYNYFLGHQLISSYEFKSDWLSREVHPHGDEIVILISGEVVFILKVESGEICTTLKEQGQYLVIPKGIWHTAKTQNKSTLLFITPGQETQHKIIE